MRTRGGLKTCGSFPEYPLKPRRTPVDQERLAKAKIAATQFFEKHRDEYMRVFTNYCSRKYRCKRTAVKFEDVEKSKRRIRNATLYDSDYYGETNGLHIWVSTRPMCYEELVGTLVHEELHCFCRVRGRFLGERADHHCMAVLGELV